MTGDKSEFERWAWSSSASRARAVEDAVEIVKALGYRIVRLEDALAPDYFGDDDGPGPHYTITDEL